MLKEKIETVLQTLSFREREIIKLRYGIGDGYTYTLEEVGRIFKVTRERVRQIEAKAIRKLQHPIRSRKLEGFLEGFIRRAQEEAAANAFRAAMLDQRRDGRFQAFDEAGDRVRRPLFERADVDLPLDAGAVGVEVRAHQREPFEDLDAKWHGFAHVMTKRRG
jgi:hypothetical protein